MTGDLISRSALLEQVRFTLPIDSERRRILADCVEVLRGLIIQAPSVDAVEVVRCKDCKHNNAEKALRKGGIWCEYWGTDPDPDDFCKRGERRADE